MNTPNNDVSGKSTGWRSFIPVSLIWLLGAANVSGDVPRPVFEPVFWREKTAETNSTLSSSSLDSSITQTQEKIAYTLNQTSENPEQKIIAILVQARKDRIMIDKTQDEFFELCHQHYLGESVIISWNPEANIQPIKRFLARIGTSVPELEKLCWVKQ